MGKIILYHGTPDKYVMPKYGGGDEKHDYGKGFYLTDNIELAKEWAVCRPNDIKLFCPFFRSSINSSFL